MKLLITKEALSTEETKEFEWKERPRPPFLSASQINLYAQCPYAYKLRYFYKVPQSMGPWLHWGKDVHKAIEEDDTEASRSSTIDTIPYVSVVQKYLLEQEDSKRESELNIDFKLLGHRFTGFIDCVTKKNKVLDYKVTSAPSYMKVSTGYQMPLYQIYMQQEVGIEAEMTYILLKRSSKGEFEKFDTFDATISPTLLKVYKEKVFPQIAERIREDWESKNFVPTFNNCSRCFVRKYCKFYKGRY